MIKNKTALCLMAHPDDAEFLCTGTLALLAKIGWEINIATMTPGQAGSTVLSAVEISRARRVEAIHSIRMIGGKYHCLEEEDVFISYDKLTLLKVIELFRKVQPTVVFTHSPSDYMLDHEITSNLAQSACMGASIHNIPTKEGKLMNTVPYLYYADPIQGKDRFGNKVLAEIVVDISSVMKTKREMLACHKSQRDWLRYISKVDEYLQNMKNYSMEVGNRIGKDFGEGFRQHLGYSYPTENILKEELQELVFELNKK